MTNFQWCLLSINILFLFLKSVQNKKHQEQPAYHFLLTLLFPLPSNQYSKHNGCYVVGSIQHFLFSMRNNTFQVSQVLVLIFRIWPKLAAMFSNHSVLYTVSEKYIYQHIIVLPSIFSGSHVFPANTGLIIDFYNLHRNPKYYPNPEKIDPDRFLPENINARPKCSFLPFSEGPRGCLGEKIWFNIKKTLILISVKHILLCVFISFHLPDKTKQSLY